MTRVALAVPAVVMAIAAAGCAVGEPQPTTYISDIGATLNADISSTFAGDTTYFWRYGETISYGSETTHQTIPIADDQPHPVSEPISGLTPGTTYHTQLCAQDEEEEPPRLVCSSDRTFTTASAEGTSGIAFFSGRTGNEEVFVMGTDGSNPTNLTTNTASDVDPAWSPDGARLAFTSGRDGNDEIYVMDADGSDQTRLTNNAASDSQPAWSPDGATIVFTSNRDGNENVYIMDADGADQNRVTINVASDSEPAWSPDGTRIAFTSTRAGNSELYVIDGDFDETRLTNDTGADHNAAWSPDGTRIAFDSDRSGSLDVWVMDADGGNPTDLASAAGSALVFFPTWAPDGDEIALVFFSPFSGLDGEILLVGYPVAGGGTDISNNSAVDSEPAWSPRP